MEAKAALVPVVRGFSSFLCTLSSCRCLQFFWSTMLSHLQFSRRQLWG